MASLLGGERKGWFCFLVVHGSAYDICSHLHYEEEGEVVVNDRDCVVGSCFVCPGRSVGGSSACVPLLRLLHSEGTVARSLRCRGKTSSPVTWSHWCTRPASPEVQSHCVFAVLR